MNCAAESTTSEPAHMARTAKIEVVATAAALLYKNGQTTERLVVAAEQLGRALGVPLRLHPHWGELALQIEGTPFSEMVPAVPLGVDMHKVLALTTVVENICDGSLPPAAAHSALESAGRLPSVSTPRFALLAAIGGVSLGVIYGTFDAASLLLIAFSAVAGALVRRWLATLSTSPFIQPLCAAAIAGLIGAAATRFHWSDAGGLVALCPCMLLVPGPHILNGAIDLARARVTLGIARLVYASLIVLMICAGLLTGLAGGGVHLPEAAALASIPLTADVIAAGGAVAAFGTFFSIPWRLLPFPIVVGMLAHAARWALMTFTGAHVAFGTLVACFVVGVIVTPVSDRLRLPFAALAFCAVVSMMPGYFLFHSTSALVELVSIGPGAPGHLVAGIVANGATGLLIILAMTFGLIMPRMLFERFLPAATRNTQSALVSKVRST